MNNFYNEVKNSELKPLEWENHYNCFRKYQELAADTLKEFHRVCEKNGILYQLAYGSLLGAIRHNGLIPWDYDIDVFVPFHEKDKLVEALKKDLSSDYYFYCPESDKRCRHFVMRVTPVGYKSEVLHVDVFYVIGSPNDKKERGNLQKNIRKLCKARYWKLMNAKVESHGKMKWYIKNIITKVPFLFIPLNYINSQYETLCKKYSIYDSKYCVTADFFSEWYEIPNELICDTKIITTQIGETRIPSRYDEMLRLVYGSYNVIPPLSERIKEVENHYNKFMYYYRK